MSYLISSVYLDNKQKVLFFPLSYEPLSFLEEIGIIWAQSQEHTSFNPQGFQKFLFIFLGKKQIYF